MNARNGTNGRGVFASSSNGESSNHSHLPENSHSKAGSGGSTSSANGHTNGHTFVTAPEEQIESKSLYEGSRLDRTEFIRITLQSLKELGYDASAKALESESGIILEHTSIIAFRKAVISGDWKNAERLLIDGLNNGARRLLGNVRLTTTPTDIESVLRDPQTRNVDSIKFLLHQQRYLELLEARQTRKALSILRDRLAPLNFGSDRLHQLSSLVICATPEELRSRAKWEGTGLVSREKLLREIESAVSPLVMVPSRRLPHLLEQAQQFQKMLDPFFNLPPDAQMSLYIDHQSDRSVFPTQISVTLSAHTDEVWHVAFSHDGTRLASVGIDREALVWSVGSSQDEFEVLYRLGPHTGPICHAAWSPDDTMLLTTTQDGEVNVWMVKSGEKTTYNEHIYTVGSAAWLPDGQHFITGSMDGRIILWNLDGTKRHTWTTTPYRVQALAVSPNGKHLVAISIRSVPVMSGSSSSGNVASNGQGAISTGSTVRDANYAAEAHLRHIQRAAVQRTDVEMSRDGEDDGRSFDEIDDLGGGSRFEGDERQRIHFYDLESQQQVGSIYLKDELTSVLFSDDSKEILVNQRPNEAQIWNVERQCLVMRLNGHKVQRHVIRSCFGGVERSFVISGSEDSCIYVYHRKTGKLLEKLKGHGIGSVNSVDWHPTLHNCFVSCSDDGTIRLWKPKMNRGGYSISSHYDDYNFNKGGHSHNGHDSDLHMEEPSPFPWSNNNSRAALASPPPRIATLGALESAITRSSTERAAPISSPRDDNEDDEDDEEEEDDDDEEEEEDDAEIMAE